MPSRYRWLVIWASVLVAPASFAQVDSTRVPSDSTRSTRDDRIIYLSPVTVIGEQLRWGQTENPIDKTDIQSAIERAGVTLIRRGVGLAGDVYLDGFKRGDLEVVIDGERYPNACPNRMDPPTTRVNPMELESIRIDKSSISDQAGLGGKVSYQRSHPSDTWLVRGGISGTASSDQGVDASLAMEYRRNRITGQYVRGQSYENARGQTFAGLYGYVPNNVTYSLREGSFHGETGSFSYGLFVSETEDIPFPYLQMDERFNQVWGLFAGYKSHKIYVNRTHHLMDNRLRTSAGSMSMESDATNWSSGISGSGYELHYRRWNLWNVMAPSSGGMWQPMEQHMIPEVHLVRATISRSIRWHGIEFSGRAGFSHIRAADETRLVFYRTLYPEAGRNRWFFPLGAGISYQRAFSSTMTAGFAAEAASEAPAPEHLYIGVKKPMGKPYWSGNPELRAPVKVTGRLFSRIGRVDGDLYLTHVSDYVYLNSRMVDKQPFVTYSGVDALLAGANIQATWDLADISAGYTWAQNRTMNAPLADIAPVTISATVRTPRWQKIRLYSRIRAATAQLRIDETLGETRTPAWYQLDLGADVLLPRVQLGLDLVNVTNRLYYQHLSYLRDPFAGGSRVYEPGRYLRLSLRFTSTGSRSE